MHNQDPKPFVWTAKANDVLQKVIRANRRFSSKKNEALHSFVVLMGGAADLGMEACSLTQRCWVEGTVWLGTVCKLRITPSF